MSDTIYRDEAIEAIEEVTWYHQNRNKDMVSGANSDEHQAWYKADDVYKALEAIPSADRPQGEWILIFNDPLRADFKCSKCLKLNSIASHYCPNCGANMEGENDVI